MAKILAGQEFGFGPVASMTSINVIKGKISLSENLIAAAIRRGDRCGYRVTWMIRNVRLSLGLAEIANGNPQF